MSHIVDSCRWTENVTLKAILITTVHVRKKLLRVKPKFHLARHVSTRHARRVELVQLAVLSESRRACVSIASSCACSNMADDEQAIVLACTSLVICAYTQIVFVLSNEIN